MSTQASDENPYAAPLAVDPVASPVSRLRPQGWMIAWTVVYGANLIVPLMFALGTVQGSGTLGMVLAMFVMWLVSLMICARARPVRSWLMAGGIAVAISQFMPILQIMAGMMGVGLASLLVRGPAEAGDDDLVRGLGAVGTSFPLGLLATLLTGAALMVASLAIGFVLVGLARLFAARKSSEIA